MHTVFHRLLIAVMLCVNGSFASAEEATASSREQLQQTAESARAGKEAASEKLEAVRSELQTTETQLLEARRALKQVEQQLKAAEEKLGEQQEADDAKRQAVDEAKAALASSQEHVDALTAAIEGQRRQVAEAKQQLAAATSEWVKHQRALEDSLRAAGQWVSFTDEIAPIIHHRCLACHNTKTAKGRLNLESFASLLKGGESGSAIEPGDGENSYLCLLIEDGSMPQDADPLTDEQIALVKRWIDLGARLDAGVDPGMPLIRVMPKPQQPAPPDAYPVAIPVTALAFSPDGSLLATSGYHEVLLWNVAEGTLVRRIGNIAERVYDLDFHPDGRRLTVAAGTPGQLGEVRIVDVTDGTLMADLITIGDVMFAATFSPDGTRLAAAGADRAIRLFDVETGTEESVIEDHADWVMSVAWSPDGSRLASASRDKTAKLFDASTGDAQLTFNKHGDVVYGVGFLPDGTQVASVGADDRIRLWDVEKAEQKRDVRGFGDDIFQIQVLPDGRGVTCSADRTARLHALAEGNEIRKFAGHNEWIYAVASHAESNRIATGSYDGEVRLWNLDDGESVLTFRAAPGLANVAP